MPRKCPYNHDVSCSKKEKDKCLTCETRIKSGQTTLVPVEPKKEPPKAEIQPKKETMKVNIEIKTPDMTCPFCLYTTKYTDFEIPLKGGKMSKKRFKCPDCGEVMRKDTLFREQTVEEFAEWMFSSEAWSRVSFEIFNKRLREMGISYQFWNHYKKYKAERLSAKTSGDREYDEYMRDMQKIREEG